MSPTAPTPTFGYHPIFDDLAPLNGRTFKRVLVLDEPVEKLFDGRAEVRVLHNSDAPLPGGLYWFEGIEEPLLLQVAQGAPPSGSAEVSAFEVDSSHPLANAYGWATELWIRAGAAVPQPAFALHEPALTVESGRDVIVRRRRFVGNRWSYTVLVDGRSESFTENKLQRPPELDDPIAWVRGDVTDVERFSATLTRSKLLGSYADTLYSFRATHTTFRPYQFKPILKLLETGKARLLVADEVGLGKTIEAGLLWTELEARGEADRTLILCPSSLLGKWKDEMEDRFGFEPVELDRNGLSNFLAKHQTGRLPRRQAYICSIERLRTWSGLQELEDSPPEFDLVIVDEAHSMRNSDTKTFKLGQQIAEWSDALVFLTATPINLHQQDLLNLLELLVPEDFRDLDDLLARLEPNAALNGVRATLQDRAMAPSERQEMLNRLHASPQGLALTMRPQYEELARILGHDHLLPSHVARARRLVAELNTLSMVITRTKKADVDDGKAMRSLQQHTVDWTTEERDFYVEYVTWCRNRAELSGQAVYFSMQMPLRLASASLQVARQRVLSSVDLTAEEVSGDAARTEPPKAPQLQPHPQLLAAARALDPGVDSKFDTLLPALRRLRDSGRKALVFTFSKPTLAYLHRRLSPDLRVAVMHGGVSREARRDIMRDFREGEYDVVLANRVASEGLDFEFCSAVVNYDLPWNPMEIEQRIGRIDRIGQAEDKMLVLNFISPETIDERILERVLDRIKIFESSIGALEPIINNQMGVLQEAFDFSLSSEERERKVDQALAAIEEKKAGLNDVTDASAALLVGGDLDVSGLEDQLVRTGRYVGQLELARLIADWAESDGADKPTLSANRQFLTLRGNSQMAERVERLVDDGRRGRHEVGSHARALRDQAEITVVLDQEAARRGAGTLLSSTHPLVMAAAGVPHHRQARFTSTLVRSRDSDAPPGVYVAVLAVARSASDGGDEVWGAAVDLQRRPAPDSVTDALLGALARAELEPRPIRERTEALASCAQKAMDELSMRQQTEQDLRDRSALALVESRKAIFAQQHERKLAALDRRIATTRERERSSVGVRLFEAQKRRTEERYRRNVEKLDAAARPEIGIDHIAVCVVEVVD